MKQDNVFYGISEPANFLGSELHVYLKNRANDKAGIRFWPRGINRIVSSDEPPQVSWVGYDDQRRNIEIDIEDIDYIVEVAR